MSIAAVFIVYFDIKETQFHQYPIIIGDYIGTSKFNQDFTNHSKMQNVLHLSH